MKFNYSNYSGNDIVKYANDLLSRIMVYLTDTDKVRINLVVLINGIITSLRTNATRLKA